MNPWLVPSMIAVTITSGTLILISVFLWRQARHRLLFNWMIGWSFLFLRFTTDLINLFHPGYITFTLISCFATLSVIYLLFGLLEMEGPLPGKSGWIWALPALITGSTLIASLKHNFFWATAPAFVVAGLVLLYIGLRFLRMKDTRSSFSGRILGYGMLLWGLHRLSNPFILLTPHFFAPLGYILGGFFAFITSIFMLFWVVEKTSRERNIFTERFGILFQNTQDIILFLSLCGDIRDANPAAEKAYGFTRAELLGMNILQLRRVDHERSVMQQMDQANLTGLLFETVHYRKDGSSFPVEVNSVGATIGGQRMLMSIVRDITGRKKAVEALRASEKMFRELFHNATDMIFLTTGAADFRIFEVNRVVIQKMGYRREELDNIPVNDLFTVENTATLDLARKELHESGHATYELILRCKNGTDLPVEINSHRFELNGRPVILSTARDISERKKAEAAILNLTFKDQLTGMYNRVYFETVLKKMNIETQLPLCVIIGDVNGLKLVNDVLGHEMGDELLKGMAAVIVEACRKDDILIRWGGDEFLLWMARTDFKSAEKICQRIQAKCRDARINRLQPSIALGCAVMETPDQTLQELFRIADERMYRNKLLESRSIRNSIIASLQKTLSEKSNETEQHAERLKNLALAIGGQIGLPQNQMDDLTLMAMLHDIGKIAIPEEVLAKPSSLTADEWQIMKQHPEIGYRIIQSVPDLAHVAEAVLAHHECWDGKGYPRGLKEREIPLISRIIAIVDAFDAMTHQRVYRKLVSAAEALAEIERCSGSQFDPELVAIFGEILRSQLEAAVTAVDGVTGQPDSGTP